MNNHRSTNSDPLNDLIQKADDQISDKELREYSTPAKFKLSWQTAASVIMSAVLLILIAFLFTPVPEKIVTRDLQDILAQARDLIDEQWQKNGKLPENIPSSTLATIVDYTPEVSGKGYILQASNGQISYQYDSDNPDSFTQVE